MRLYRASVLVGPSERKNRSTNHPRSDDKHNTYRVRPHVVEIAQVRGQGDHTGARIPRAVLLGDAWDMV